jgi:penicillin-binding protein 2B
MKRENQNRGLRNTGRVTLILITTIFFFFFVATAVSFALIAGTGTAREQNLYALALDTYLARNSVSARRGTITDRNGRPIAAQHPSYTMYANFHPDWGTIVEDIDYTAQKLAEVIDMEVEEIIQNLSRDAWQLEFGVAGQRLSFTRKNEIEALELPGIYFRDALTRFYPNGVFASHIIGYTMHGEAGELIGAMGLESYFDDILTGRDGSYQFLRDWFGMPQPNQERIYIREPRDGYDITLTLDATIQMFLETAFDESFEDDESNIENMVAVIMDVRTGEILAAASRPTFDPNTRDLEDYMNAIMYPFEPGSTIKIFTYAAAINEGVYQGDQIFTSGSRLLPGNIRIHDFQRNWGDISFDEGFLRSSNTAVVDILRHWMRSDIWIDYLEAFGFNDRVNLPLPTFEPAGVIPDINESPVDLFMTGFGQGRITVTPVQQLQALTAILNEGQMVRPQLISEIFDPNTETVIESFEREIVGEPITAATARQVQDLMIGVVDNPAGTGHNLYDLDVPSGGKTGTAQLYDPETGLYHTHRHVYSYIGFAPAENPEIMMYIALERKRESLQPERTGHSYAAPIYRSVMNKTLRYLGLGPAIPYSEVQLPHVERIHVPNIVNLTVEEAVLTIQTAGLTPIVIGNKDRVFGQSPTPNATIIIDDKVFIQTDIEDQLPNFTGWSRAQITTYASLLGLNVEFRGQGLGVRQTIRAGRTVQAGDRVIITLE